ncbi:MAG: membrane protein insertion efficiency factor YidD [Acidimicrobiales bacterium]
MTPHPSLPARAALRLIALYQSAREGRPSPCRFVPSCSTYAFGAIETFGLGRGGALAGRRILRCHPFGAHGVDLVPVRVEEPRR